MSWVTEIDAILLDFVIVCVSTRSGAVGQHFIMLAASLSQMDIISSLDSLSKRQEQALSKKEKQNQDLQEEMKELRRVQDAIFNLSKSRGGSTSGAC